MKIDCKKIINAYSVAVVKDIEKELNYIQYLESLSSDPTNVGKNVICPVCRNVYCKESVAQKTCSTRCNLGLYHNLSIRALRQMSASQYRLAVSAQNIMAQIRSYVFISKLQVGKTFSCPTCSTAVYKKSYQKAFCSTMCKDRFWNVVDTIRLSRMRTRRY